MVVFCPQCLEVKFDLGVLTGFHEYCFNCGSKLQNNPNAEQKLELIKNIIARAESPDESFTEDILRAYDEIKVIVKSKI